MGTLLVGEDEDPQRPAKVVQLLRGGATKAEIRQNLGNHPGMHLESVIIFSQKGGRKIGDP